ncbi:MAG: CCA tRNA nucleotidyltransferase [Treponemataceae bacterium]|nr:CCA tRNA nucleotidyltransferase [Treponemataceae bacterium]
MVLRVPYQLTEVAMILQQHGFKAYLVGGAVRDLVRGVPAKDWDIATDARPETVLRLFRRVIPTGIKHGTVTIHHKGLEIETTTFRIEAGYSDGRHPDTVQYVPTIEEDLSRRDFTMNAMAYQLPRGPLVDPFKGQDDIQRKLIRCVGDPLKRFSEDGLRPLRAVRFAAQLEYRIDEATLAAIPQTLSITGGVAKERIREELDRILASRQPSIAFRLMEHTGLLSLLFPELSQCRGIEQRGFHRFDVLDHSLLACDVAPSHKPVVRMAALLHDIGKPLVRQKDPEGTWTFYQHEQESVRLTRQMLVGLRYPNAFIDAVCHLINHHMFYYESSWTDAAVRRLIARLGAEHIEDMLDLRRSDAWATTGIEPPPEYNRELQERIEHILRHNSALTLKDLAINGEDLASLGIPRGPLMGRILKELLQTVLDDPAENTKERLSRIALCLYEKLRT